MLLGTAGIASLVKASGWIIGIVMVVPMLLRLLMVTVDEGEAAIRTRNGKPLVARRDMPEVVHRRGRRAGHVRRLAVQRGDYIVHMAGTWPACPLLYWYRKVDVRLRATDLPARHMTGLHGHQFVVHASIEWAPIPTGGDVRLSELGVTNLTETVTNIVGASLRDVVARIAGPCLPPNAELSRLVTEACATELRATCGARLGSVRLTGDALADGYQTAQALLGKNAAHPDGIADPARGTALAAVRLLHPVP